MDSKCPNCNKKNIAVLDEDLMECYDCGKTFPKEGTMYVEMNQQLAKHVEDALILMEGCEFTDLDVKSERGAIYFNYGKLRFRVDDRYYVEQRMEIGYQVTEIALILQSLLRHRGAMSEMHRVKMTEIVHVARKATV